MCIFEQFKLLLCTFRGALGKNPTNLKANCENGTGVLSKEPGKQPSCSKVSSYFKEKLIYPSFPDPRKRSIRNLLPKLANTQKIDGFTSQILLNLQKCNFLCQQFFE